MDVVGAADGDAVADLDRPLEIRVVFKIAVVHGSDLSVIDASVTVMALLPWPLSMVFAAIVRVYRLQRLLLEDVLLFLLFLGRCLLQVAIRARLAVVHEADLRTGRVASAIGRTCVLLWVVVLVVVSRRVGV